MIHLHSDGEPVRNGINIYRSSNPTWGVVLRYGPKNAQGRATKIFVIKI